MPIRSSRPRLCLSLLIALWTSGATSAGAESRVVGETVPLTLSPFSASAIRVDEEAVAQSVCTSIDLDPDWVKGKCKIVATNWPPPETGWMKLADPIEASCGTFDGSVKTASVHFLPGSEAMLEENPEDPTHGVFAGSFEMTLHLRFTNRETGRAVDFEMRRAFRLQGPWALASPQERPTSDNVIFLADRVDGRLMAIEEQIPAEDECEFYLYPDWRKFPGLSKIEAFP